MMMVIPRLWMLGGLLLAVALVGGCGGGDDQPSPPSDDAESSVQDDLSQDPQKVDEEASPQSSAWVLARAARGEVQRAQTVADEAHQRAESLAQQASALTAQAEAAASAATHAAAAHAQALKAAGDMERAADAAATEAEAAKASRAQRQSAEQLLNTLMQQIRDGEYESAGQALGQLDELKQSLPASVVTQINAARTLLNALRSINPEVESS